VRTLSSFGTISLALYSHISLLGPRPIHIYKSNSNGLGPRPIHIYKSNSNDLSKLILKLFLAIVAKIESNSLSIMFYFFRGIPANLLSIFPKQLLLAIPAPCGTCGYMRPGHMFYPVCCRTLVFKRVFHFT
jgi:hypothetical protein